MECFNAHDRNDVILGLFRELLASVQLKIDMAPKNMSFYSIISMQILCKICYVESIKNLVSLYKLMNLN